MINVIPSMPMSLTFLDASKRNKLATKEHHSSKNYSSELKQENQGNQGTRLNPNQTKILKLCKEEENRPKTLRFNLLGGGMGFFSLETEEYCALAEHLAEI